MALPTKGPSQLFYCDPIHTEKQVNNMPSSCSTDVFSEEPPAWFKDLLNEPGSSVNKTHHRRSASDSSAYLAAPESSCGDHESWFRNPFGRPDGACSSQMPVHCRYGVPPGSFDRAPGSRLQDNKLRLRPSTFPKLANGLINAKEDAECQALGMTCSPEPARIRHYAGNESDNNPGPKASFASENSSGKDPSHTKPVSTLNTDAKRKQHNARRSRVRKLQYIAELERNAHVLQAAGAEVSAQLEFLDQQNLILGMENRALKQRLDSLSQEHFIKSMEQQILDKELGRLQYLYHLQRNFNHQQHRHRQKQNHAVHRRGRSVNDLDPQLTRPGFNPSRAVAASHGAPQ
ncbi:unnamed protein product [Amaranthus hypochondriacus]